MGISVADNFKHLSKKFLDDRESFDTLADMKAISDSDIPEGFETYCKATDKRYKFLSTNSVDANTGKWREVEYGGGGTSDYTDLENKPSIEGVTLTGNKTAEDLGLAKDEDLPGVYAGDTAGLVPAAGSDNEGKYLDNDGNWTDPLEDFVQIHGGKVLLDIPANAYASYILAVNAIIDVLDTLSREELNSIKIRWGNLCYTFARTNDGRTYYSFFYNTMTSTDSNNGTFVTMLLAKNIGAHVGNWNLPTSNSNPTYSNTDKTSAAQNTDIQLIDTSVSATMIGKINRSDIYDTTEKVVGKWTDGKPVYQCTFTGTISYATANNRKFTALGLNNIDNIVSISGYSYTGTAALVIPYGVSGDGVAVFYDKSSHDASIVLQSATTGTWTYYLTMCYTKTTDAANSYNYADENDYSTSEKIIGKWIDGKTLYQKTVNFGALPNNTAKSVAHGISSLGEIINIAGSSYILGGAGMSTKYYIDIPNNNQAINISVDSTNIYVTTESDLSSSTAYVTLKYTKTS